MLNSALLTLAALIVSLAFAGLAIAAIVALVQLRRTVQVAEQTLASVEREVRPLAADLHALLQQHRDLAQQATHNLRDVQGVVAAVQEVVARAGRLTSILGSVGTVGRTLGVAQGLAKGAAVFLSLLRRRRG